MRLIRSAEAISANHLRRFGKAGGDAHTKTQFFGLATFGLATFELTPWYPQLLP
ncbi:MAG: hypothetical protein HC881_21080 [Leptolyngbyaceae cyanobacterium SL_7_1]|nr:hypothetical protein [Leptolyngbyaceae cyanobacterium SL_7_1]